MKYCFKCGHQLENRELKGEGVIPYCEACGEYRFPIFSTAVSMIVLNAAKDSVLLIQQYGRKRNILVAGYVSQGEAAEETVAREVLEETGLKVTGCRFNKSAFFKPSNTLMLNFACTVEDMAFSLTDEVDQAAWFTKEEAREAIYDNSLAESFLLYYLDGETA